MDGSFELLFPHEFDLKAIGFEVPTFEWGGVLYPQGALSYKFGRNFNLKLLEQSNVWLMTSKFPFHFKDIQWNAVEVSGDGIDIFINSLLGLDKEEEGFTLRDMLVSITEKSPIWMAVYQYQDDGFQWSMKGTVETVLSNLERNILAESEGFLVYYP